MTRRPAFAAVSILGVLAGLTGCGGGGASSSPPPATPTFTLTLSPPSLQIPAGGSGFTTVTVSRLNGFQGAIAVTGLGLPAGASASGTLPADSGSLQLPIAVGAGVTQTTFTNLQIEGRSGNLAQSAAFSLTVKPALPPNQISVDLLQAPGVLQQTGQVANQVVVAEPFRAITATNAAGTAQIRHGFLPSGTPVKP